MGRGNERGENASTAAAKAQASPAEEIRAWAKETLAYEAEGVLAKKART